MTDKAIKELFPENKHLHRWIDAAQERVEFEGLPARICWLGYGERARAGLLFNQLVKEGKVIPITEAAATTCQRPCGPLPFTPKEPRWAELSGCRRLTAEIIG